MEIQTAGVQDSKGGVKSPVLTGHVQKKIKNSDTVTCSRVKRDKGFHFTAPFDNSETEFEDSFNRESCGYFFQYYRSS